MPTDPVVLGTLAHVTGATLWTLLGVLLLYGGIRLFDRLDPIDYRAELERGNTAVAMLVAAQILALAAIIVAAIVT